MLLELKISELVWYDYLVSEEQEVSGLAEHENQILTESEICKLTWVPNVDRTWDLSINTNTKCWKNMRSPN